MPANKGRTGQSSSSSQYQTEGSTSGGQSSGSSATSQARAALDTVQQKASEATEQLADRAHSTLHQTRTMMVDQVRSLANAIDKATESLRHDDQGMLAHRAQQLTQKVHEASDYLEKKSPRELMDDVERIARRNTAWFLGSAFALGLIAARFLKSSERHRDGDGMSRWQSSRMLPSGARTTQATRSGSYGGSGSYGTGGPGSYGSSGTGSPGIEGVGYGTT